MNQKKVVSIIMILGMLFGFANIAPAAATEGCSSSGEPLVITDQEDYSPYEVVIITGTGFSCGVELQVLVTAPDGSTRSGDGTGASGPDVAITDSSGGFILSYQLYGMLPDGSPYSGQEGQYAIQVMDAAGAVLASAVFSDGVGDGHSCAITTGGGLKCWGYNNYGQLGTGDTSYRYTPFDVVGLSSGVAQVSLGGFHTCALMTTGGVKCWGRNTFGQLGNNSTTNSSIPVDVVGLGSGVIQISAGKDHNCALLDDHGIKCWGWNLSAQLGDGNAWVYPYYSSIPVDVVGLSSGVAEVSLGYWHTCALMESGGVKCWGMFAEGSGGPVYESPVDIPGLSSGAIQIRTGYWHNCVLMETGGVKCWGMNWNGELGQGTFVGSSSTPVDVIGLGSSVSQLSISGNAQHTCALTVGGGLKCWGHNRYGQLGTGIFSTSSPYAIPYPVDVLGLDSGVTQVSSGSYHTCALTTGGGVKCWGRNYYAQLGVGYRSLSSPYGIAAPVDVFGLTSGVASLPDGIPIWNYAPVASAGGPYLGADNTLIQFDGSSSSDPDGDPLSYAWDFGDGSTGTGEMPTHHYPYPGIYDVCLVVNDGALGSTPDCTLAVVYDPQGGFVTGGGWIESQPGAYLPDPSLAGKASFGFVSEYTKGAKAPTGQTEFQFKAGDLNFHSSSYQWLVVNQAGTDAQFKGEGTLNGALAPNGSAYKFMIWAKDLDPAVDTFRIKIWYEEGDLEIVVYDNGFDQTIGGGQIQIHTK